MTSPPPLRRAARLRRVATATDTEELRRAVERVGEIPIRRLRPALRTLRTLLATGLADDRIAAALEVLHDRFPESAELELLHSQLCSWQGLDAEAARHAGRARLLDPTDPATVVRAVTTGYRLDPHADADTRAVAAVRRFPTDATVLGAVARHCDSVRHYHRIHAAWAEATTGPQQLAPVVAPLALAADRAWLTETARDLYRQVFTLAADPAAAKPPAAAARPASTEDAAPRPSRAALRQAIADVDALLDRLDIAHVLLGTGLAAVAEDRLPDTATGIDLGLLTAGTRSRVTAAVAEHPRLLTEPPHPGGSTVELRHRGGVAIRLDWLHASADRVHRHGRFQRWTHEPFAVETVTVAGMTLSVPADVGRFLAESRHPQVINERRRELDRLASAWVRLCEGDRAAAAALLAEPDAVPTAAPAPGPPAD